MTPDEIKRIRLAAGMTRTQLANFLGYTVYARVWEIETGKRRPGRAVIKLLEIMRDTGWKLDKKLLDN